LNPDGIAIIPRRLASSVILRLIARSSSSEELHVEDPARQEHLVERRRNFSFAKHAVTTCFEAELGSAPHQFLDERGTRSVGSSDDVRPDILRHSKTSCVEP
jgi:hypothetical protein